jgi:hypothetical protein
VNEKNQKIASWVCERGGQADVYQTVKRGRHFYTRCDCCGLNQGTGAARQQQIFDEAVFLDRSAVAVPSGVSAAGAKVVEQEPVKKPAAESVNPGPGADFDPSAIVESGEQEQEKPRSALRFLPAVALLVAAGAGLWMN